MQSIALLSKFYPSWPLSELKKVPHRMREWWIEMGVWRTRKGV